MKPSRRCYIHLNSSHAPQQPLYTDVNNFHVSDYEDIVRSVIKVYDSIEDTVEDNHNPRSRFAGCLVRMAGHDFMDFRVGEENQGGSDGCVSFEDPDNKGLQKCMVKADMPKVYS